MTKTEELQQKAQDLQREFALKIDAICKEYGYMLQPQITIVAVSPEVLAKEEANKSVVEKAQEIVENAEKEEITPEVIAPDESK